MDDRTDSQPSARALAFRRYVEPEIEVLLRVAQTLTGSWDDAEDLVQESMIRAYGAVDRFDGRHPRAWLLTILRNTNANMHRRRRPDLVDSWDALRSVRPVFGASPPAPADERAMDRVLDEPLRAAVAALGPRFRVVLLLVDVDDLTYAEAAHVLGVPIGTVMSRLHRARARVRKSLESPAEPGRRP